MSKGGKKREDVITWNIVYHVVSDGFFLLWIIRLFVVGRRYFAMETYITTDPPEAVYPKKTRMEKYMEAHKEEIQARQKKCMRGNKSGH